MNYKIAFKMLEGMGTALAFATVTINDQIEIPGFKIVSGSKGVFVGMPQTAGKENAETGKREYYDNVRFTDFDTETKRSAHKDELCKMILDAYNREVGASKRATSASANASAPTPSGARPGGKKAPF